MQLAGAKVLLHTVNPRILIADGPTTALDVTVQAQVLGLLEESKVRGNALIFISHDLAVVSRIADEVLVMHEGEVLERGSADTSSRSCSTPIPPSFWMQCHLLAREALVYRYCPLHGRRGRSHALWSNYPRIDIASGRAQRDKPCEAVQRARWRAADNRRRCLL